MRLRLCSWWLLSSLLMSSSSLTVFSTLMRRGIDADDVFGALVLVGPNLRFSRLTDFFFDFCPVLALLLLLREDDDDREPPSRDRGTLDKST